MLATALYSLSSASQFSLFGHRPWNPSSEMDLHNNSFKALDSPALLFQRHSCTEWSKPGSVRNFYSAV